MPLPIFFLSERKHWSKNHEIKNGGHRTRFCDRATESEHQMYFLRFLRGLGRVSKWHVCGRGKKALKNPFLQHIHRDITVNTQCDKDGAKIKIKKS